MFACEHEDVVPDFLCVAKGLTGGYLPLAATLTTERVFDGFLGEYDEFKTFFHGHTYTGNPLACAAANATLDVFEQERTLARLQDRIALLDQLLNELVAPLPYVKEVRRMGFMCGIELTPDSRGERMGHRVTLEARARGAIVRPLGDVLVLMPPLSIQADVLEELVEIVADSISAASASVPQLSANSAVARSLLSLVTPATGVLLARAAHGAEPVVGNALERRPRVDAAVRVALHRVVDESA